MNKKIIKLIAITTLTATLLGTTGYYAVANEIKEEQRIDNKAPEGDSLKIFVDKHVKNYKEMPEIKDVPKEKKFDIKFNSPIIDNSVNIRDGIKVIDKNGIEQNVTVSYIGGTKIISVSAPFGGYKEWERYALIVKGNLINKGEKHQLQQETVQYFTIKGTGVNPAETTTSDDIAPLKIDFKEVLKDYRGGRTDFERKQGSKNEYTQNELRGLVSKYKKGEYFNTVNTFDKKYRDKEEYASITDPKYYLKVPGITIDYTNANTKAIPFFPWATIDDGIGRIIDLGSETSSEKYPEVYAQYVEHPYEAFTDEYTEKYGPYGRINTKANEFIWRIDVEEDAIKYINELRKKNGLKELKLNANLTSLAKYTASRNFYESSCSRTGTNIGSFRAASETIKDINKFWERVDGAGRDEKVKYRYVYANWIDGIPYAFEDDSKNEKYDRGRCTTTDVLKKIFDYDKKIYNFNYDSIVWTDAREMINYMLKGNMDTKKIAMNSNGKDRFEKDLRDVIYRKDITEIGVGSLYSLPHNVLELNGQLGMSIMTQ